MPAFRRRMRRRTRGRRRGHGVARQALSLARRAWAASDHEVKFIDLSIDDANVPQPATSVPLLMNAIAEGASFQERIGEVASLKRIDVRLTFDKHANNNDPVTFVRVMLVWDKQPNGGLATVGSILENPNIHVGNEDANILSQLNAQTRPRFGILKDSLLPMSDGHNANRTLKWSVGLSNRKVQYNGAGGAIANINTGALLLLVMGNITDGGSVSTVSGQIRMFFVG